MMTIHLYDYFRSSACFRVRIALNLKKLTYDKISIHLLNNGGEQFSEQYKKVNPQALVPSLEMDDKILTQSLAIIEYLDEIHPTPPLLPSNPFDRAQVRAFALSIAADIHPLNNLRVLTYLKNEFHISDEQKMKWIKHWIGKGLMSLESQLNAAKANTPFCFGDQPTLADICLVPQLYNAKRFDCDLSSYPTLTRIDQHCQQLAAFTEAWPEEAIV